MHRREKQAAMPPAEKEKSLYDEYMASRQDRTALSFSLGLPVSLFWLVWPSWFGEYAACKPGVVTKGLRGLNRQYERRMGSPVKVVCLVFTS